MSSCHFQSFPQVSFQQLKCAVHWNNPKSTQSKSSPPSVQMGCVLAAWVKSRETVRLPLQVSSLPQALVFFSGLVTVVSAHCLLSQVRRGEVKRKDRQEKSSLSWTV